MPTQVGEYVGATYLTANPIFHACMKHVEIDFHFVREMERHGLLDVRIISSEDQIIDALTKPLPTDCFLLLRDKLLLSPRASFSLREDVKNKRNNGL